MNPMMVALGLASLAGGPIEEPELVVGFTGTKEGMRPAQRERLMSVLWRWHRGYCAFHHGDCVGADAEAHEVARVAGYHVVIHPPTDPKHRAFCEGDEVLEPLPYLERNERIVQAAQVLIATPKEYAEQIRSGTWTTYRRAIAAQLPVCVIFPDGSTRKENWEEKRARQLFLPI